MLSHPNAHPKAKTRSRLLALGGIAGVVLAVSGTSAMGCNGSAVGVQACQTIEEKRCDLAKACVDAKGKGIDGVPKITTATEVSNCKILYRDECRVGIENTNTTKEPSKDQVDGCVKALTQTIACQASGQTTMATCTDSAGNQVDVDTKGMSLSPCATFENPEHLTACAFIAKSSTSSTTGAGGGGG